MVGSVLGVKGALLWWMSATGRFTTQYASAGPGARQDQAHHADHYPEPAPTHPFDGTRAPLGNLLVRPR